MFFYEHKNSLSRQLAFQNCFKLTDWNGDSTQSVKFDWSHGIGHEWWNIDWLESFSEVSSKLNMKYIWVNTLIIGLRTSDNMLCDDSALFRLPTIASILNFRDSQSVEAIAFCFHPRSKVGYRNEIPKIHDYGYIRLQRRNNSAFVFSCGQ